MSSPRKRYKTLLELVEAAKRDELLAAAHETLSPQDVALAHAISKTIVIPNTIDRS